MLKYISEEMVFDVPPGDKSAMVIDVNAQAVLDLDRVGRRFMKEYPHTTAMYNTLCLQGKIDAPRIITAEENGRQILLVVTAFYRIGDYKDSADTIALNASKIITKLEHVFEKEEITFYSGIFNRYTEAWKQIEPLLKVSPLNWIVLKD